MGGNGCNWEKQIFIMGWCIGVSNRIRGQGWNIIRNNREHITCRCMGTLVKSDKMLHRRGMVIKGRWRCGRRSYNLTPPLTLTGQVWNGFGNFP